MLAYVWEFTVQAGDDRDTKLTRRELARDWARTGQQVLSADEIAARWFDATASSEPLFPINDNSVRAAQGSPVTQPPLLKAAPYSFPDPTKIPRREFLYGKHYIREYLSVTGSPGGLGKTALETVEALAMVSGKPLLGIQSRGQCRVWYFNGEDPLVEMERRFAAAMLYYGLTPEDIGDRLFLNSGRDTQLVIAKQTPSGATIMEPVVGALIETIRENRIDVLQVDPFVSSHQVKESDNDAIDLVAKQGWGVIASATKCAVELVHHVRKTNGAEITPEDMRGAGALVNAARAARTLNRMTKSDADKFKITEHRRYFRFGEAKENLSPPRSDEHTEWMKLESQPLGNGEGSTPVEAMMTGDNIGVVTRFQPPSAAMAHGATGLDEALKEIAAGEWRYDARTGDKWVGHPIAAALKLDVVENAKELKNIIAEFIRDGRLRTVRRPDASRHMRQFVEVVPRQDLGVFE